MEDKWMLRAVFVLALCLTRNLTSGHGDRTSLDSNKTPHSPDSTTVRLEGFRNESFEVDSRVTLLCTNPNIAWSEMIYVIWKISSQEKNCSIAVARNDLNVDTCQDGKKINISKGGDYSLIIPHFSIKDEGNYTCDVSYHAGGYVESIYVSAWVHPVMTGRLETKGGHTFAICEVQSLPAASIHWETPWNSSSPDTHSSRDASRVFTVTSWLQLPKNALHRNLTCVVIASHSKWPETRLTISTCKDTVECPSVLLGVWATWIIIKLLTGLYIMHKTLRQFR
ncbi:uncharacterized protein LOC118810428 [Colossoma macropomum]|uniref:uncharacterized protein LOC118810428 n=1 Tax=Colossoma macropomum TaxID=42526 RepID=UPI0018640F5E|nr:uncharacterized protein LOC118810428 [Colossoma macropomum]